MSHQKIFGKVTLTIVKNRDILIINVNYQILNNLYSEFSVWYKHQ